MTATDTKQYNAILEQVGDPEKAQPMFLRWKCQTDLYFLGTEIFGWKKVHTGKRWLIDPKFHGWMANLMQKEENCLILVARKSLKTTWKKAKIVQSVLNYPNRRRGLFSVTPRLVEYTLGAICVMLCNPVLLKLFPDILRPPGKDFRNWEKKTHNEVTIYRDSAFGYVPQEPQLSALGNLAKVQGLRVDECHPDDILDDSTVRSAALMDKCEDWWAYMQSVLETGGYTQMTGTPYHYSDLYAKIIREKHFPKSRIYVRPAIVNGKIQYKSWFRKKDFDDIRKISGEYIFNCQYLLDPVPKGMEIFPPPQPTFTQLPPDEYRYYITVDPAATTHDYSDDTGITVAAVNKQKQIFIVESIGIKKRGEEIARFLIDKCVQYEPDRVGIEFGLQIDLKYTLEHMKAEYENRTRTKVKMNILPIPISSRVSKVEKINMSLGAYIRLGKCRISEKCVDLIRQMDLFTGKGKEKDDLVDSASLIFATVEGFAVGHWTQGLDNFMQGMTMRDLFKRKQGYSWGGEFAHYTAN